MTDLFGGDVDSELKIVTDNEFAKNYDNWRRKEELNKLKTKYGDETLQDLEDDDDTTSSSDDEIGAAWTDEVEKDFFKTLSYLKNKDPCIYDNNVKFFDNDATAATAKKETNEEIMSFTNYESKIVTKTNESEDEEEEEKEEEEEEEEEEDSRPRSPTYVEQQKRMREMFFIADQDNTDESEDDIDEVFEYGQGDGDTYKAYLLGENNEIEDKAAEAELKPLKDFWNDANLDEGEKFIRNFILQDKYIEPSSREEIDLDENLSEDEKVVEAQEEFEHKYNFRFEEPDPEFIKSYPRTLEHSVRKTDDKRKIKRIEYKERKQKEKEQKMQELKTLQELKRSEIEEKIDKIKEITGNNEIGFKDIDFDGDFDPDAHDKRMQDLFNNEFYEGAEEEQKPVFPEFDEYLELENWDRWTGNDANEEDESGPHCEDENFNMDCDYDPAAVQKERTEKLKGKKKHKKKSLFTKILAEPKPVFDPKDKTYQQYLDEYYNLNCEDIIGGDTFCRFKYREVIPNSFGLSVEEILLAKDSELNRWCGLKKLSQHRPEHVEVYDQIAFEKKAKNFELKKRILPSLFEAENSKNENNTVSTEAKQQNPIQIESKSKNSKRVKKEIREEIEGKGAESEVVSGVEAPKPKTKKEKKMRKESSNETISTEEISVETGTDVSNKKKKDSKLTNVTERKNVDNKGRKKRKPDKVNETDKDPRKKIKKTFKNSSNRDSQVKISDARLIAYGINPKKFKNKQKFGKKK